MPGKVNPRGLIIRSSIKWVLPRSESVNAVAIELLSRYLSQKNQTNQLSCRPRITLIRTELKRVAKIIGFVFGLMAAPRGHAVPDYTKSVLKAALIAMSKPVSHPCHFLPWEDTYRYVLYGSSVYPL